MPEWTMLISPIFMDFRQCDSPYWSIFCIPTMLTKHATANIYVHTHHLYYEPKSAIHSEISFLEFEAL
jgi:hypothetical protein